MKYFEKTYKNPNTHLASRLIFEMAELKKNREFLIAYFIDPPQYLKNDM